MVQYSKPLVSISCITYNHAPFIRECLDSFLMQKTTFSFEVVIHDDCSTDGTKEIIEEYVMRYPKQIFPIYQNQNQYSKGVRGMMVRYNFPRCSGKYIAMCEGDDYWTDSYKLQKQVDFLEANPKYIACSHQTKVLRSEKDHFFEDRYNFADSKDLGLKEIVSTEDPLHTSSFLFKNTLIPYLISFYKKWGRPFSGDTVFYTLSCKLGSIKFLNEEMSVYRLHRGGVTSGITNDIPRYLLTQYITWVLLSKEFPKSEREKHFEPIISYYENYLIQRVKKMRLSILFEEIKFFYLSNPIEFSTKFKLTYKLFKNKITKSI